MQLIAEAYDLLRRGLGHDAGARSRRCSGTGTPATWSRSSSRSPPRCSRTPTPRPARRSSTWCSTRPSRRAPAGGPCRSRSTSGCRSAASPRRCSPARCPGTPSSATAARGLPGPAADGTVDRGRLRRRRRAGAVRVQGRRVRAGLRRDHRRRRRSTAGTSTAARWPRSGAAAASSGPGSSTGSRRRTTGTPSCPRCWSTDYFAAAVADGPGGLAPGGGDRGPGRACRRRASPRRWPTTTGCGRERLPAALVQGLRDLFGAHTYRRVDTRRRRSTRSGRPTAPRCLPTSPQVDRLSRLANTISHDDDTVSGPAERPTRVRTDAVTRTVRWSCSRPAWATCAPPSTGWPSGSPPTAPGW